MGPPLAHSVGLAGDLDEVDAIRDVEREFGVKLDYSDSRNWVTAGHVYAALCDALPPDAPGEGRWDRFAAALAQQTGVDPALLTIDSPLIGPRVPTPWWIYVIVVTVGIACVFVFR